MVVAGSALYRGLIRPLIPEAVRGHLRRASLPPPPPRPPSPRLETVGWMIERLGGDAEGISRLAGRALWDLEEVLRRHAERCARGDGT
jgi:hypothetical protein